MTQPSDKTGVDQGVSEHYKESDNSPEDQRYAIIETTHDALVAEINRQTQVAHGLGETGAAEANEVFRRINVADLATVAFETVTEAFADDLVKQLASMGGEPVKRSAPSLVTLAYEGDLEYGREHLEFVCHDETIAQFYSTLFGPAFGHELRALREAEATDHEIEVILKPDWERRMRGEALRQEHYAYTTDSFARELLTEEDGSPKLLIPEVRIKVTGG